MHHHFLRILVCVSISFTLFSCGEESKTTEAQKAVEGEYVDTDSTVSSSGLPAPIDEETGQPQIYGKWKIISKYVGELILSEADLGEATTEFTIDGEMIRSTPDLGSQSTTYTLETDKIKSVQEGEFNIVRITVDTLILTQIVDQEIIKETYTRIP